MHTATASFAPQLNFTFTDNTASEATAIFMSNAQVCSWIGNYRPHFDTTSILRWPFLYIRLRVNILMLCVTCLLLYLLYSDRNMRNTSFIETSIAQTDIVNETVCVKCVCYCI